MHARLAIVAVTLALALTPRLCRAQLQGHGTGTITTPANDTSFPTDPPNNPDTANVEVDGTGTEGFINGQANQQVTVSWAATVFDVTDFKNLASTSGGGTETAGPDGSWKANWSLTSDASFSIGSYNVQTRGNITGISPSFGEVITLSEPYVSFSVYYGD